MEVLARHVARCGASTGDAGAALEDSVFGAVKRRIDNGSAGQDYWLWTQQRSGVAKYRELVVTYRKIYDPLRDCYTTNGMRDADAQVRKLLESHKEGHPQLSSLDAVSAPHQQDAQYVSLPISAIGFAHDGQSEIFGRDRDGWESRGLLQLAVELWSGDVSPDSVEPFTVTRYSNQWYCRSGNRRLASLKLAERARCGQSFGKPLGPLRLRVQQVDAAFTGARGGRAKLTTFTNGRLLEVRETGESVGNEALPAETGQESFGADLLSLLALLDLPLSWAGA